MQSRSLASRYYKLPFSIIFSNKKSTYKILRLIISAIIDFQPEVENLDWKLTPMAIQENPNTVGSLTVQRLAFCPTLSSQWGAGLGPSISSSHTIRFAKSFSASLFAHVTNSGMLDIFSC